MVRSLLRNRFLASCWVIEEPPWTTPPAFALVRTARNVPGDVDAEMLVEAPVLGGEHRLDQVIGQLVERDRMAVLDAAAADLVAVAVEEGHRELGLLQPVLVGGLAERRAGERQHQHEAAEAHGGHFRQRLDDEPPPPSRDMEAVHDVAVALECLARQAEAAEQPEVEAGIEVEQGILDPGDEPRLRQDQRSAHLARRRIRAALPCGPARPGSELDPARSLHY